MPLLLSKKLGKINGIISQTNFHLNSSPSVCEALPQRLLEEEFQTMMEACPPFIQQKQTFMSSKNGGRTATWQLHKWASVSPLLSVFRLEQLGLDVALGNVALGAGSATRADHNQTSKCFSRCCKPTFLGRRV